MSKILSVFINDQSAFEYDAETELEDRQLEFLDKMDADMDRGIKIKGEFFERPDANRRTLFMTMNLIKALQQDDSSKISASCAYLISRRPELIEIRAKDQDGSVTIELIDV